MNIKTGLWIHTYDLKYKITLLWYGNVYKSIGIPILFELYNVILLYNEQ